MDCTCIICLEVITEFKDKITLSCEHMFHKTCYKLYDKPICPICKKTNEYQFINNITRNDNNNTRNNNILSLDDLMFPMLEDIPETVEIISQRVNINNRPPWI